MKTKYLDNEIELLNDIKINEELSDYGKEKLIEFNEIKKALTIPVVGYQREKFLDFAKNLNKYLFLEVREELLERFTDSYIKNNNYEN